MKSCEMKPKKAIEKMELMTLEELAEFTEGEERDEVLNAQEERISELSKPPSEDGEDEVEPAQHDLWVYHKEHAPRLIKGHEWPEHHRQGFKRSQAEAGSTHVMNHHSGEWEKPEE